MSIYGTVFRYFAMIPEFSNSFNRIMKRIENQKPPWYKVELSKQERKGRTSEEIQIMRKQKWEDLQNESRTTNPD